MFFNRTKPVFDSEFADKIIESFRDVKAIAVERNDGGVYLDEREFTGYSHSGKNVFVNFEPPYLKMWSDITFLCHFSKKDRRRLLKFFGKKANEYNEETKRLRKAELDISNEKVKKAIQGRFEDQEKYRRKASDSSNG